MNRRLSSMIALLALLGGLAEGPFRGRFPAGVSTRGSAEIGLVADRPAAGLDPARAGSDDSSSLSGGPSRPGAAVIPVFSGYRSGGSREKSRDPNRAAPLRAETFGPAVPDGTRSPDPSMDGRSPASLRSQRNIQLLI